MSAYKVVEATPATAALIPEVIYRGYGYTYSDTALYDPFDIARQISDGQSIFFVGLDGDGRPRGLLALRFLFPAWNLVEAGALVIDPELPVNGSGWLLRLLVTAMTDKAKWLARERGVRGLISMETTLHTLTQRMVEQFGFVPTGLLLGRIPSWADRPRFIPGERAGDGATGSGARNSLVLNRRRNETVSVRPFRKGCAPYSVTLPAPLEEILRRLYGNLRLPVEFRAAIPAAGNSEISVNVDVRRARVMIEFLRVGADAVSVVLEKLRHYREGMLDLLYVAIPLSEVSADSLVGALLEFGCRFAALIPFYRSHDTVWLEYLNGVNVELVTSDFFSPTIRGLAQHELDATRRPGPHVPPSIGELRV